MRLRILFVTLSIAVVAACGQRDDASGESPSSPQTVAEGPTVYQTAVAATDRLILRFVKPH